jgi:hypothetical protein
MDFDSLLESNETSKALLNSVQSSIEDIGEATMHTTKSQIAFRRRAQFRLGVDTCPIPQT